MMNPTEHASTAAISADNFTLYIALAFAALACAAYFILGFRKRKSGESDLEKFARAAYYVSFVCVGYTSLYLMQGILSGARYDISYIYENSSLKDSLLYRISSFWAGQGGSLLLWALICGLIGILLLRRLDRASPLLISFWCSVQTFLLVLLVVDDPMKKLVGYQPGTMGSGLNPLLKNPWMAIHPPVVFIGYALLIVPAAFAVQALIEGDGSRWVRKCLPWALAGWTALTAGLVLGMVWSYEVLGWGGYWGWDPVENASLVPWLMSTALVHGLVLQRYRNRMAHANIILAMGTFLTILYATFLTRSGVLSDVSVHSFGKTPAYGWLIVFPVFFAVVCIGITMIRWNAISRSGKTMKADSKDFVLATGAVVMSLFAGMVLVGTSYTTFNKKAVLDSGFYTHMSVPLAIAAVVLIALAPLMKWGGSESKKENSPLAYTSLGLLGIGAAALIAGIITMLAPGTKHALFGWMLPGGDTDSRIAVTALSALLGTGALALVVSIRSGAKSSLMQSGAYIAHAGVALMVLGIVFSTSGPSTTLDLPAHGIPASAYGYDFIFTGHRQPSADKEIIDIKVSRGASSFNAPLLFVSSDRGKTTFPFIRYSLVNDLYISPQEVSGQVITPTVSMADKGWVAQPVGVPGARAAVALIGMQVESHSAKLVYQAMGGKQIDFTVAEGSPATVDGYKFTFKGFVSNGAKNMEKVTAGVDLGVTGHGLTEKAVIRVSRKPLISLLWLGLALIFTGGVIAFARRRAEKTA